eukprot:1161627-Pelagomonas_calceolata.AAC.4
MTRHGLGYGQLRGGVQFSSQPGIVLGYTELMTRHGPRFGLAQGENTIWLMAWQSSGNMKAL